MILEKIQTHRQLNQQKIKLMYLSMPLILPRTLRVFWEYLQNISQQLYFSSASKELQIAAKSWTTSLKFLLSRQSFSFQLLPAWLGLQEYIFYPAFVLVRKCQDQLIFRLPHKFA